MTFYLKYQCVAHICFSHTSHAFFSLSPLRFLRCYFTETLWSLPSFLFS